MTDKDFIPSRYTVDKTEGKVTYRSPSNIALVKYWGKRQHQIPANPSISFTLDTCATTTTLIYKKLDNQTSDFTFDLLFEGKPKEDFKPKINAFFKRTEPYLPFLKTYHFTIETSNSFPHSSGIASSASGMSALALCLMELERELNPEMDPNFYKRKASFLARLGSGSACRSIEGDLIQWGAHKDTLNSSDLYAIKYPYKVHPIFKNYQDTILLVDKGSKQVSSSLGHNLMHDHPFAEQRFDQAHKNLSKLKSIFENGNLLEFIKIVESEALTLHAMMMTSMPYFMLMKPNTLEIINKIWAFRASSKTHICFTLDAGANVHVLYPEKEKEKVYQFISNELVAYCENGQYICDQIGKGAKKL
ncbi:diphosphomevalonate decarboxylase [Arenibacter sp. F26102]|uniref:diphosphomevalonate/mevalonate 3,5-bisphosphate decarboxylase family protein n=1 Tax=Arenibacter sp. F26102 TaxID=2926416 RepID=UPI001FF3041D|nr:diphosphomevalonate decarboxylase [Arenibacter sp. F26102]MCK0146253.1 diphosphomevalonate decarboxylase [Arenibacter sp. F26102]